MKIPILLPNIFDYPFTYDSSNLDLKLGDYVIVPFGKTKMTGLVWNQFEKNPKKKFLTRKITKKLNISSLNVNTIKFLNWFSEYNMVPKGMSLKLHLLSNEAIESQYDKEYREYNLVKKTNKIRLSDEQSKSAKKIMEADGKFRVHVLQGTTGSGKTIVYFNCLKKKIEQGYQGLILLPEIVLTSEFQSKFKEFFGFEAAIWHSAISKKRKKIIWSGLAAGEIKVIIGARSSLFLPFKKLGIIIVDEEHDQSFKQDEGVIYNARDMAISRASFENIPINLITAVPSIETFENIKKGKYSYSRLFKRYKDAKLPEHEIINLNEHKLSSYSWIASKTIEKVKLHLNKKDQVLFFLNRRGFSPYVLCKKCLKVYSCPNCSINLVYHKNKKNLLCHYCGYKTELKRSCNDGKNCDFVFSGPGVERILEDIKKIFPDKKSIGTQLISKVFIFQI